MHKAVYNFRFTSPGQILYTMPTLSALYFADTVCGAAFFGEHCRSRFELHCVGFAHDMLTKERT